MKELKQDLIDALDDHVESFGGMSDEILNGIIDMVIPKEYTTLLELAIDDLDLALEAPAVYGFDGEHNAINAIVGVLYQKLERIARKHLNFY